MRPAVLLAGAVGVSSPARVRRAPAASKRRRLELQPGRLHEIFLVGGSTAPRAAIERFLAS